MYAVIKTGGKQYRVAPGDTIRIERVIGEVGEKVTFGSVLAVHTDEKKVVLGLGRFQGQVTGKIVEQGRSKKVIVLKFKKTNQYKISARTPAELHRRAGRRHQALAGGGLGVSRENRGRREHQERCGGPKPGAYTKRLHRKGMRHGT